MVDSIQNHARNLWRQFDGNEDAQERGRLYRAYRDSEHWQRLHRLVEQERPKECEFCGAKENIDLHHIRYKHWHDALTSDLVFLCREHHNVVTKAQDMEQIPKQGAIQALTRQTFCLLGRHDTARWNATIQKLETAIAQPEANFEKTEETLEKRSGVSTWLTGLLMAGSMAVGLWIGVAVIDEGPRNEPSEQVK